MQLDIQSHTAKCNGFGITYRHPRGTLWPSNVCFFATQDFPKDSPALHQRLMSQPESMHPEFLQLSRDQAGCSRNINFRSREDRSWLTISVLRLIQDDWTPAQACTVVELLDDLRDVIFSHYLLQIQQYLQDDRIEYTRSTDFTLDDLTSRVPIHLFQGPSGPLPIVSANAELCHICAFLHRH
jgi:hypothetical protein